MPVLPQTHWRTESFLTLLAGLLICLGLGGTINSLLQEGDWLTLRFVVGTVTFHGGVLICVQLLLKVDGTGWREAFGLSEGRRLRVVGIGVLAALRVLPFAWLLSHLSG